MNVICIMLDSLRTDHVGAYGKAHTGGSDAEAWPGGAGQARARTPAMDRFAQSSLVFDRAYAGSFPTLPCRRDLFTGRWGHPFNTWDEMERHLPTMAESFRKSGGDPGPLYNLGEVNFQRWQQAHSARDPAAERWRDKAIEAYRAVNSLESGYRGSRRRLLELGVATP